MGEIATDSGKTRQTRPTLGVLALLGVVVIVLAVLWLLSLLSRVGGDFSNDVYISICLVVVAGFGTFRLGRLGIRLCAGGRSRLVGTVAFIGAAGVASLFFLLAVGIACAEGGTANKIMLIAVVVIAGFLCALKVVRYGRRHFAVEATRALLMDERPPVTYLRSFRDERYAKAASGDQVPEEKLTAVLKYWSGYRATGWG